VSQLPVETFSSHMNFLRVFTLLSNKTGKHTQRVHLASNQWQYINVTRGLSPTTGITLISTLLLTYLLNYLIT